MRKNKTKDDMADFVAQETGILKKDAKIAVDAMIEFIISSNEDGQRVMLMGLGSFYPHTRDKRNGYNPVTKTEQEVPAITVPKFKPGTMYRERLKALRTDEDNDNDN